MKIIVGLGNPGPQYETTRHNVGFLAIDRLVEKWKATGPTTKHHSDCFQGTAKGQSILLLKPKTFMNLSGKSVASAFQFYHCTPDDLIVIHDDLDLPSMVLRIKTGGGAGGHNGLKSIDECLGKGHNAYHRIRIGIGHPARLTPPARISPADYVLQQYDDHELTDLDPLLNEVTHAIEEIYTNGTKSAMNQFHRPKE